MGLQFIGNQPILFNYDPDTFSECKSCGGNDYQCSYYTQDDNLYAQWRQTPCDGTNRLCNPTFINSNPELITNGGFDTNTTGWTLSGTAAYDAVNQRVNFGSAGTLTKSGLSLTAGTVYQLIIDFGGGTSGNNELAISLGGNIQYVLGSGTVTLTLTAGAGSTLVFSGTNFNGWIDNISMKLDIWNSINDWIAFYTNNPTPGSTVISAVNGTVVKAPGYGQVLQQQICSGQFLGAYYKYKIKVSGMTAGKIWISELAPDFPTCWTNYCDPTQYLTEITADGVYDGWTTGTGLGFFLYFSVDCNATVSDLEMIEYAKFHTVILKNLNSATQYNLSGSLTYYQDWLTLKYDLASTPAGSYQLCITDACGYSLGQYITSDPGFDLSINDPYGWTYIPEYGDVASYLNTASKFRITASTPTGAPYLAWRLQDTYINAFLIPNPLTTATFRFTMITAAVDEEFKVQLIVPGATTQPFIIPFAEKYSTYTGTVTLNFGGSGWNSSDYTIRCNTAGVGNGISNNEKIEIEYFLLELDSYYPGQSTEYCSECIEVTTEDDCLKWVGGFNGEDSYGFHFDPSNPSAFQIGARVKSMLINPKYPGDLKRYEDAEGNIIVTKGKSGKVYTLFIDYSDEHTHDWLRLAVLSDTIDIDGKYYVGTDGDYEPEWPSNLGDNGFAQARVDVQRKVDVLYNNNAG